MHYRGLVIVNRPTDRAVKKAMAPHGFDGGGSRWDWWRVGGRFDGYLQKEEAARATHGGHNFDPSHQDIARNHVRVADLPADRRDVNFFVSDGEWIVDVDPEFD